MSGDTTFMVVEGVFIGLLLCGCVYEAFKRDVARDTAAYWRGRFLSEALRGQRLAKPITAEPLRGSEPAEQASTAAETPCRPVAREDESGRA